ncbi:unnamed protein product [Parnassius mnemosyne]|uniref:Uncharacterized protein n=1 Tax=Parnassius mnemosyne TaxID=213953 RepID=A0AAV1KJD2_9NEOP
MVSLSAIDIKHKIQNFIQIVETISDKAIISLYTQGVSSPVYRAVSSPVVYNAYRTQPVNYVSYPTTYTAAVPQVYSSPVYTQTSQVSAPTVYDAEHSSKTTSTSHYKVQSPSTVTTYSVQQAPTYSVQQALSLQWCCQKTRRKSKRDKLYFAFLI